MPNPEDDIRLVPAEFDDGWLLVIDGDVQSHVDLTDPELIRFEYLRRIGNLVDTVWPAGQPVHALHLGAGAFTLPRYIHATRPGSVQTVVESHPEVPEFVLDQLPLDPTAELRIEIGDARRIVQAMTHQHFDVVILDILTGHETSPHLTGTGFYAELLERLTRRGILIVNIGDDDGHDFLNDQYHALDTAAAHAGHYGVWQLADTTTLRDRTAGNVVLTAGGGLPQRAQDCAALHRRLLSAGPYPAHVVSPAEDRL